MRMIHFLLVAAVGGTLARATPFLDRPIAMSEAVSRYAAYVLADDTDADLFWVSYTRLRLAPVEEAPEIPDFSMTYLPEGVVLQLSLLPEVDWDGLAPLIAAIRAERPAARFVPLPVEAGRYVAALRHAASGLDELLPADDVPDVPHLDPREPRTLALHFGDPMASLLVLGLAGGSGVGINYEYEFVATVQPTVVRARYDWSEVEAGLRASGAGAAVLSSSSVERLSRDLAARGAVAIEVVGGAGDSGPAFRKVTELLRDACLTRVGGGRTLGWRVKDRGCDDMPASFELSAPRRQRFVAQAGFQLGPLCGTHPRHFAFRDALGRLTRGCPDGIYAVGAGPHQLRAAPRPRSPEVPAPLLPSQLESS
jgi:hypothetical protein